MRENSDIWWSIFNFYPSGKWAGWRIFTLHFWRSGYVWHDSFGKYFNRHVYCKFFGHPENQVQPINEQQLHCFACETRVKEPK